MLPHEAKNIPELSPGIGLDFPLQKCADQIQISPDTNKLPVYHKVTGAFTIALYQSHDQIHGHAIFAIPLFPCFQRTAFCVIGTANAAFLLENGVVEFHDTVLVHRWSFQHSDGLPGKGDLLFLTDTAEVQHLQYRTVQLRFFLFGDADLPHQPVFWFTHNISASIRNDRRLGFISCRFFDVSHLLCSWTSMPPYFDSPFSDAIILRTTTFSTQFECHSDLRASALHPSNPSTFPASAFFSTFGDFFLILKSDILSAVKGTQR